MFSDTVLDFINSAYFTLRSPALQNELFPAKLVFIGFSVLFIVFIGYLLIISSYLTHHVFFDLGAFLNLRPAKGQKLARQWRKIEKRFETGGEYNFRLAVIEADDLLKEILAEKGYKGKNFDESISKLSKTQLPNIEEVIEAHKKRNSIVHDPNYKPEKDSVNKLLKVYERGIKNLESF